MKLSHYNPFTRLVIVDATLLGGAQAATLPSGYSRITHDQNSIESLSLGLMGSPVVQAAQKQIEEVHRRDTVYQTPGATRGGASRYVTGTNIAVARRVCALRYRHQMWNHQGE